MTPNGMKNGFGIGYFGQYIGIGWRKDDEKIGNYAFYKIGKN